MDSTKKTLIDICNEIKEAGQYTDTSIADLSEAIKNSEWDSYKDPELLTFMSTINKLDFDSRIQDLLSKIVEKMYEKGIQTPCFSGCDPECPFKEFE